MPPAPEALIFDFTTPQAVTAWHAIDDRIMGGTSQSQADYIDGGGLCFSGSVSLENQGGFASIRSADADHDLGGFLGLALHLRGDGKTYKLSLRTDDFFDGISYQSAFSTRQDGWHDIALPFSDFKPTHHGLQLSTIAPLDASRVRSFGLFIADRQQGPFRLNVAWIKGYA